MAGNIIFSHLKHEKIYCLPAVATLLLLIQTPLLKEKRKKGFFPFFFPNYFNQME